MTDCKNTHEENWKRRRKRTLLYVRHALFSVYFDASPPFSPSPPFPFQPPLLLLRRSRTAPRPNRPPLINFKKINIYWNKSTIRLCIVILFNCVLYSFFFFFSSATATAPGNTQTAPQSSHSAISYILKSIKISKNKSVYRHFIHLCILFLFFLFLFYFLCYCPRKDRG